jgi:hypothetical protein
VEQVMVSLARDGGGDPAPVSVRVEQAATQRIEPLAGESAAPGRQRRTEGLGQGLRPAARLSRQAGAIR